MNYLRKCSKWLLLGAMAGALGMLMLYVLKGHGIKKDILCLGLIAGSLCMWRVSSCKWWIAPAEAGLLLLHYFGVWQSDGILLAAMAAAWLFPVSIRCDRWYGLKLCLLAVFFAGVNFVLVQDGLQLLWRIASIGWPRILLNMACFAGTYFALYALCGSWKAAVVTGLSATVFFAALNLQVCNFRGSEIKPMDIFSLGTAVQVVGNYRPQITVALIRNWIISALCALYVGIHIRVEKRRWIWGRAGAAVAAFLCAALVMGNRDLVLKSNFQMSGSRDNGFFLNFAANTMGLEKPAGYASFDFEALEAAFAAGAEQQLPEDAPNILVVMNESYADLRTLGDSFQTDVPVYSFYDSLRENTIRGRALVSVLGGNTANSEYEFLTGNSMAFLPDGVVSYLQYVDENTFALPSYLQALGYRTVAMHPAIATNWARQRVWEQLGFEERQFIEDFPCEKYVRGYVSDEELYDQVLSTLAASDPEKPTFLFALTMQNHGGYTAQGYESTVKLEGLSGSYPDVEQYLSLMRESDRALEKLISGLQDLEKETVVLFFGDHFPKLADGFLQEVRGPADTLADRQKLYEVPCFLWANYDIPEGEMPLTGLSYLSMDLLELAGIPQPDYARFLEELRREVPAMNLLGWYSREQQGYLSWDQQQEPMLETYRILIYDSIRGGRNRSSLFDLPN